MIWPTLNSTFSGRTDCSLARCRIETLLCLVCFLCLSPWLTSCGKKDATKSAAGAAAGPHIKWQFKSSSAGVSHPAVSPDGTIYIGTNSALQAISPDGKLIWQSPLNTAGTPVVSDDGTIYLDSMHGIVFGVSKDGKLIWHPGYGLIGFGAPPALGENTTLYFLNSVSDIYAFQPKLSEEKLWSLDTFRENMLGASTVLPGSAQVGVFQRSSPVITSNGSILLPRQNFLDFVSPHGSPESDVEVSSGHLGQAALASDGTIYIGDDGAHLFALDSSGAQKWQMDIGVRGSPVIDTEGEIYVCDGAAVYAMNPDGTLRWRWSPSSRIQLLTSLALAADGTIYVGGEFALIALKPDGSLKFNLRVYSPTSAPTIAPDGTIYFACGYFWLCAVEDSGSPLMQSAWPKQFHDLANSSNVLHSTN